MKQWPSEVPARILQVVLVALFLFGTILLVWVRVFVDRPLDERALMVDSLKYSIPLAVVFIFIACRIPDPDPLRGASGGPLVIALIALYSIPLWTYGTMTLVNRYQDRAPSSTHEAQVLHKDLGLGLLRRMSDDTSYFLQVASWRQGVGTERIQVSESEFRMAVPGKSNVVVVTRPGALGYEWVESAELQGRVT